MRFRLLNVMGLIGYCMLLVQEFSIFTWSLHAILTVLSWSFGLVICGTNLLIRPLETTRTDTRPEEEESAPANKPKSKRKLRRYDDDA